MKNMLASLLFFFILIALVAMLIFQLMCLADLEFDYINPYDTASRINKMILPEFITQGFLCFIFIMNGNWIMALISTPYLCYNVMLYVNGKHRVDVTEIFNLLSWEKKQRLFKLGYMVLLLCMSLFWLIYSTLEDDERSLV